MNVQEPPSLSWDCPDPPSLADPSDTYLYLLQDKGDHKQAKPSVQSHNRESPRE